MENRHGAASHLVRDCLEGETIHTHVEHLLDNFGVAELPVMVDAFDVLGVLADSHHAETSFDADISQSHSLLLQSAHFAYVFRSDVVGVGDSGELTHVRESLLVSVIRNQASAHTVLSCLCEESNNFFNTSMEYFGI